MKLFYLIAAFALISCSRSGSDNVEPNDPTVTNVQFYPVQSGSNQSVAFKVSVNIPNPSAVNRLVLYRFNTQAEMSYIDDPASGQHLLYDHVISSYPTYNDFAYYNLAFEMSNGQKIALPKFQVY